MEDESAVYTLGRFQPYSNHHDAAIRLLVDEVEEDVEEVYVGILRTPSNSRTASNPFTDEEVYRMVDEAAEAYELPYDLEPFVFGDNPLDHHDYVGSVVGSDTTFVTREKSWKWVSDALSLLDRLTPGNGTHVDSFYVPRDQDRIEEVARSAGYEVVESSTEVRQKIAEGDRDWRKYVSDPVEEVIEEEFRDAVGILQELQEGEGKNLDKFQVGDRIKEYMGQAFPDIEGGVQEETA